MAMNYGSKPVMSSVMPQVGGITIVDETTPNLEMIQSFPVVSRDGNVHIHQDPNTGQMYQMTTEFHSRIPQIVASQKMMTSRNGTIGNITFGVMPPTGRRTRGRNITINLSIEDVTFLKDRYGPTNDTDDPTCAIMRAYFNELNRDPKLDIPIYPCEGFPPGVTEQYVTVNYRLSGGRNKTRIFRFFLDANGQCRCETVDRIPGDFEDRGSGPTGPGTGMGNLGSLGNVTFGVTQPNRRRNRGRNLTIDLSIEDVNFLKDRYGPNNDTVDPTCAIMRAYFNELNRNPNLDTPIYPCEGFGPGVTEQYVTVNYRISGGRNKTRIFRFFLDANGQCKCEIVNRIPSDVEDRGSGPTGPSGGMGNPSTSTPSTSISSLSASDYLKSLLNTTSRPANLVTTTVEPFSAPLVSSQDLLDSAYGLTSVTNQGVATPRSGITSFNNVNLPGVITQQDRTNLQNIVQTTMSNQQRVMQSMTQTQPNRLNVVGNQTRNGNTFAINRESLRQNGMTNTQRFQYTANRFSPIGTSGNIQSAQSTPITQLTNRFTPVNPISNVNTITGISSRQIVNKFYKA